MNTIKHWLLYNVQRTQSCVYRYHLCELFSKIMLDISNVVNALNIWPFKIKIKIVLVYLDGNENKNVLIEILSRVEYQFFFPMLSLAPLRKPLYCAHCYRLYMHKQRKMCALTIYKTHEILWCPNWLYINGCNRIKCARGMKGTRDAIYAAKLFFESFHPCIFI